MFKNFKRANLEILFGKSLSVNSFSSSRSSAVQLPISGGNFSNSFFNGKTFIGTNFVAKQSY
jgi:hypothetical protein